MTYGMKAVKTGKSIDSTDPNDFIFHYLYNTFKIISQGTATHTATSGTTTKTIAHNQSYIPFVYLFIKWGDGLVGMPLGYRKGKNYVLYMNLYCSSYYVDATNITLKIVNNTGTNEDISIAYLICEAPTTAN